MVKVNDVPGAPIALPASSAMETAVLKLPPAGRMSGVGTTAEICGAAWAVAASSSEEAAIVAIRRTVQVAVRRALRLASGAGRRGRERLRVIMRAVVSKAPPGHRARGAASTGRHGPHA